MPLVDWETPAAIAHRGSRLLWPENTMEAFRGAISLGYTFLETDLRITSDGVVVCIHDGTVDRTTEGSGEVSALTFEEISSLDAGFRHRSPEGHEFRGAGVRIPAFEEVLVAFPHARFVVDLKADGLIEGLVELIDKHGLASRLIVGSFSDDRLARFTAATRGEVPTSTGPRLTRLWVLSSRVGRRGGGTASALQVPTQMRGLRVIDRKLVETAHAFDLQVHVWTVNDPSEMVQLLDLGVDGIVTDRVDLLREVLEDRGQWRGR